MALTCRKIENAMTASIDFLYLKNEAHIRLYCDGVSLSAEGLPEESDSLPAGLKEALCNIFSLLESRVPALDGICVSGVYFREKDPVFCAMDIWLEAEGKGCYLSMATAASLFSDNGIPYYHQPIL